MTTITFAGRHGFQKGDVTKIGEKDFIVTTAAETLLTVRNPYWGEIWLINAWFKIKKVVKSNKKRLKNLLIKGLLTIDDTVMTLILSGVTVLCVAFAASLIGFVLCLAWSGM